MFKINKKRIFFWGAVVGLLIFLHFAKILKPIENATVFILNPFTSGASSVVSDIAGNFSKRKNENELGNQIILLEKERNHLLSENTRLKIAEDENNELRKHLDFLSKNKYKYVLANVIAKNSFLILNENKQAIIIDKGSKDGLFPGLSLVDGEGVILGKISQVKDNLSEAYLTIDPNCSLAAMVYGENKTMGIASGDLGLTIKMDFVPQTENIFKGDLVVTSGLEEKIPKGLLIGKVSQVIQGNNEVWQQAVIEPIVNLDNLNIVSVLLP